LAFEAGTEISPPGFNASERISGIFDLLEDFGDLIGESPSGDASLDLSIGSTSFTATVLIDISLGIDLSRLSSNSVTDAAFIRINDIQALITFSVNDIDASVVFGPASFSIADGSASVTIGAELLSERSDLGDDDLPQFINEMSVGRLKSGNNFVNFLTQLPWNMVGEICAVLPITVSLTDQLTLYPMVSVKEDLFDGFVSVPSLDFDLSSSTVILIAFFFFCLLIPHTLQFSIRNS